VYIMYFEKKKRKNIDQSKKMARQMV